VDFSNSSCHPKAILRLQWTFLSSCFNGMTISMCCVGLIKKWSPLLQSRLRVAAATHKGGLCDLSRGAAVPPPSRAFLVSRRWQRRLSTAFSPGVSFQFSRVKFFACSLPRKNERYLSPRFFSLFHLCHCWCYIVALLEVGGEQRAQLLFYLPLERCSQFRGGEAKLIFAREPKTFGMSLML
jgi:hypothetical protein